VFAFMEQTDAVIRSRYPKTGFYSWPTIEGLDAVCKRLHEKVRKAIRESGTAMP